MSSFFPVIYLNCDEVKEQEEKAFNIAHNPEDIPYGATIKILVTNAMLGTNTQDGDLEIIKKAIKAYTSVKG